MGSAGGHVIAQLVAVDSRSHSPHGECGLKYLIGPDYPQELDMSLPAWGVRVEIWTRLRRLPPTRSLPAWGVRVEIRNSLISLAMSLRSLPAWGVRVEMRRSLRCAATTRRHSPHGECGLKYQARLRKVRSPWSLPAWGVRVEINRQSCERAPQESLPAWGVRVEISQSRTGMPWLKCHSPHGECGLKSGSCRAPSTNRGHSPHGECGLKSLRVRGSHELHRSLPAWGVRVEICRLLSIRSNCPVTPRMGSAG